MVALLLRSPPEPPAIQCRAGLEHGDNRSDDRQPGAAMMRIIASTTRSPQLSWS
jgi:hypothetical protein